MFRSNSMEYLCGIVKIGFAFERLNLEMKPELDVTKIQDSGYSTRKPFPKCRDVISVRIFHYI